MSTEASQVKMSTPDGFVNNSARIEHVILHYAGLIARGQNPVELLHLSAAMARDLVGADRCSIWLVDMKARELYTTIAHGLKEIRVPYGAGLVGTCVAQGQPIIVNDTGSDPRFLGSVDKATGYRTDAVAVIPLRSADGSVMGALQALNKPGGFAVSDADLLNLVASYSAAMMEGQRLRQEAEATRLLYHELEVARDVQREMFPKSLPQLPDFEYAAACRSAKFVGGDYYDWFSLPTGSLAFTIGDVSGKGIAAALVMAGIQSSLRGELMGASGGIAGCLAEFNNRLFRSTASERYSTLFCGVFDCASRLLTYVNCGHVSPILCRGSVGGGTIERLDTGGIPAGLLPVASFQQAEVILAPGDVLVCFSDGFSEATNSHGEMWDESVLEEAVLKTRGSDAGQIVGDLFAAADEFTDGAEQSDDMTMVVLRSL
jgi:sigma-B regulation protein RsbU (phosphoserine phosphatase)